MKHHILIVLTFCLSFQFVNAQNESKSDDFIDIGIRYGLITESDFLKNSHYSNALSDPLKEESGIIPYTPGRSFGIRARYGKITLKRLYLLGEVGYSERREKVIPFCHSCDLLAYPQTLVTINSVDIGMGFRYTILSKNAFTVSLETIGNYSTSINEKGLHYFGYHILPIVECELIEGLAVIIKYGFEESFGDYIKQENYLELGLQLKI